MATCFSFANSTVKTWLLCVILHAILLCVYDLSLLYNLFFPCVEIEFFIIIIIITKKRQWFGGGGWWYVGEYYLVASVFLWVYICWVFLILFLKQMCHLSLSADVYLPSCLIISDVNLMNEYYVLSSVVFHWWRFNKNRKFWPTRKCLVCFISNISTSYLTLLALLLLLLAWLI